MIVIGEGESTVFNYLLHLTISSSFGFSISTEVSGDVTTIERPIHRSGAPPWTMMGEHLSFDVSICGHQWFINNAAHCPVIDEGIENTELIEKLKY